MIDKDLSLSSSVCSCIINPGHRLAHTFPIKIMMFVSSLRIYTKRSVNVEFIQRQATSLLSGALIHNLIFEQKWSQPLKCVIFKLKYSVQQILIDIL